MSKLLRIFFIVKSCIRETLNLLTDADSSTDTKTASVFLFNFSLFILFYIFCGDGVTKFLSFLVSKFPSFKFSKWEGKRGTNERPGNCSCDLRAN